MTTKPQNVSQQVTFMFQMSKSVGCPLTDDTPIVLTVLKLAPFIFKVYSSNLMKKKDIWTNILMAFLIWLLFYFQSSNTCDQMVVFF